MSFTMQHSTPDKAPLRRAVALRRGLALLLLLTSSPAWPAPEPGLTVNTAQQEKAYRDAIKGIEAVYGAYGPGLSEQILSLGTTLQSQGRHEEAVQLFKRGVHLARINDGLYSAQQLPLLQGQVASHIALGQYAEADERQHYMYRVQLRTMDNSQGRTQALMQQASWQYDAYQLGLGEAGFLRLMAMWDLYRLALTDTLDREGDASPALLPPLQGMLQAQYLIAAYQPEDGYSGADDLGARQQLHRFNAYRAQSYEKGNAVIMAIYDIEQKQEEAQPTQAATETIAAAEIETDTDTETSTESKPETETETESLSFAPAELGQPPVAPKGTTAVPEDAQAPAQGGEANPGLASARALVMLGDWRLWHEEREPALKAYGDAIAELVQRDDAQLQIDRVFAEPVALPDLDGLRPLPPPAASAESNILLEFGVTHKGRVVDLERIDENEVNTAQANRLMRKLRKTKFRPRFENGEPVDTEKMVRAYGIE
jgi:hypothetical protein